MRLRHICAAVTVFLYGLTYAPARAQTDQRIPILLDTDIGTDIDDAFALGLAFGSHELDVRGITTVGDDTRKRAMMACRFLTVTGRRHTRVAAGEKPQPSRPITDQTKYYYHPDALFNRTTKPEKQSAADFLHGRVKQQPGKVTLVAIGPLTNIARLIETHADSAAMIQRVILLESNIALDVEAARKVFESGIPLVVLKSDVCRNLRLDDAGVKSVFSPGTPLTRQVETLYQMWDRHSPPLGEALAVALCFDERFAAFEKRSLRVGDKGSLKEGKAKPNARVVTSVKSDEFVAWYVERMASLVAPQHKPCRLLEDGKMPHRVHVIATWLLRDSRKNDGSTPP